MTNDQIRKRLDTLEARLRTIDHKKQSTLLELRQLREKCQHSKISWWTNNDGDGQFRVERCEVCGLQRDGGLPGDYGLQMRTKKTA